LGVAVDGIARRLSAGLDRIETGLHTVEAELLAPRVEAPAM
jgi:hypothetical protein